MRTAVVLFCASVTFPALYALGGCASEERAGPPPSPSSSAITSAPSRTYDYTHKVLRRHQGRPASRYTIAILRFGDTRPVEDVPFGSQVEQPRQQTGDVNVDIRIGDGVSAALPAGPPPQMNRRAREMLKHALVASEAFTVLERERVLDVLREINFGKTAYVDSETSAPDGGLLAVRYLVEGSLGPSEDRTFKGTLPDEPGYRDIDLDQPGWLNNVFSPGHISRQQRLDALRDVVERRLRERARRVFNTACYLSAYDVHTGEVAATVMGLGTNNQEAIEDAVDELVDSLAQAQPSIRIAAVLGDRLYLDAGTLAGLQAGDRFQVSHVGTPIRDHNGIVIGHDEIEAGEIVIQEVREQLSVATQVAGTGPFQRGDIVRPAQH